MGEDAEDYADNYLRQRGLQVLQRNYRCRFGEIDLIAKDGDMLVFVEVRLRNNRRFGSGADSIDAGKRRRLSTTANLYLAEHCSHSPPPCRFDVVSLSTDLDRGTGYSVEWLKNAFSSET